MRRLWRPRGAVMRYEMEGNSFAASAVKAGMSFNQTRAVIPQGH